jgi:hypothetical protein
MQIKQALVYALRPGIVATALVVATSASAADYKIVVPAAPGGG